MSCGRHYERRQQFQGQIRDAWPLLNSWQTQLTKGNVRIGDSEREQAAEALGDHYAAGRLDHDEYDERLNAVFEAQTWGELAPVFRDLPSPGPMAPRPRMPARRPGPPRFGLPLFPVILVLIGLAILTHTGWVFWVGLGAFLIIRAKYRSRQRSQASGSWRAPGGSWA